MSERKDKVNITMEPVLRRFLVGLAEREERSFSQQVNYLIKLGLLHLGIEEIMAQAESDKPLAYDERMAAASFDEPPPPDPEPDWRVPS